jgi:hypothetical protein
MQFIITEDDIYYPVSRIEKIKVVRIETPYSERKDVKIFVDGHWERVLINEHDIAPLISTIIVPAGQYSAVVYSPSEVDSDGAAYEERVEVTPIVAFALTPEGNVEPIGMAGTDFGTRDTIGILRPDGVVEIPLMSEFRSVEAFKIGMRERDERIKAHKAEREAKEKARQEKEAAGEAA